MSEGASSQGRPVHSALKNTNVENNNFGGGERFKPTVFRTSRKMDFFSKSALITQTGHDAPEWPLVFLKESIDNALDACEEGRTNPLVALVVDKHGMFVTDNGPGIPDETVLGVLDLSTRVSSREAYVTPSRGAQGNALMTLVGMPFVLDPESGTLIIESHGKSREVRVTSNALTQEPEISVSEGVLSNNEARKLGTRIGIRWREWPVELFHTHPKETGSGTERKIQDQVFDLLRGYALFNPHLTLEVDWFGRKETYTATTDSFKKWRPNQPSSAHWYQESQLRRLIGAYVAHDQQRNENRTVADFLTVFDSLKGSAKRKKVIETVGMSRWKLSDLANRDGMKEDAIRELLQAMQENTKPIKAMRLGVIGKDHMMKRFTSWGCVKSSIRYTKVTAVDMEGMPFVLEVAFGVLNGFLEAEVGRRQLFAGANFSAAIKNPFREFGSTGAGLDGALARAYAGCDEPVIFATHLVRPSIQYTDRGKSAIAL